MDHRLLPFVFHGAPRATTRFGGRGPINTQGMFQGGLKKKTIWFAGADDRRVVLGGRGGHCWVGGYDQALGENSSARMSVLEALERGQG